MQSTISQAYATAFGRDVSKWRAQIQEHSKRVILVLGARHGADETSEWTRAEIGLAIEQEIRKHAPGEVHDAYLDLHPERRPRNVEWSRFEAKRESDQDEDALWSIQRPSAQIVPSVAMDPGVLGELGVPARAGKTTASKPPKQAARPCMKSHWMAFWGRQADRAITPYDREAWDKAVAKIPAVHMVKTPEEWWWFGKTHWKRRFCWIRVPLNFGASATNGVSEHGFAARTGLTVATCLATKKPVFFAKTMPLAELCIVGSGKST